MFYYKSNEIIHSIRLIESTGSGLYFAKQSLCMSACYTYALARWKLLQSCIRCKWTNQTTMFLFIYFNALKKKSSTRILIRTHARTLRAYFISFYFYAEGSSGRNSCGERKKIKLLKSNGRSSQSPFWSPILSHSTIDGEQHFMQFNFQPTNILTKYSAVNFPNNLQPFNSVTQ